MDKKLEYLGTSFLQMSSIADIRNLLENCLGECNPKEQEEVMKCTILSDHCIKFPPSRVYKKGFLKAFIFIVEKHNKEVCEIAYDKYLELLNSHNDLLYYKVYHVENHGNITIMEKSQLVSEGTTGLCAWEAGFALTDWCLQNKDVVANKRILELGCGIGLTGVIVTKFCHPSSYVLSDCHDSVISMAEKNVEINLTCEDNVSVILLDWGDVEKKDFASLKPDLILAADVIYDGEITILFVNVLNILLENAACAIIALAVRNPDTIKEFTSLLVKSQLKYNQLSWCKSKYLKQISGDVLIFKIELE